MWGLTVGAGSGMGRGGQRGKNWDNHNRITKIRIKTMRGKFGKEYIDIIMIPDILLSTLDA